MAGALGGLLVTLGLDSAEFTRGLTQAEHESRRAMKNIQREAEAMGRLVGAAAVIAGAGAVAMSAKFISAAADLDDLSEKTGAAVEQLSKYEQVARIGGHSTETYETALIRMNKALHAQDDEAKGAGKALAALGLSQESLRNKDPAEALRIIAGELNKFADGGGKSALAIDLLGKSGAQALPFLKDLATEQGLLTRVTTQQAADAEELGKSWRRLMNDARGLGQSLAIELVPTLQSIVTQMRLAKELGGGFLGGVAKFFSVSGSDPIGEINETRKKLETLKALRADLMKPSLAGFVADVGDTLSFGLGSNDLAGVNKQIQAAEERMKFLTKLAISQGGTDKFDLMTSKPVLDYKPTDDAAKKKLEEIKKLYEEASKLGAAIDVPLLPIETFLQGGLDKAKTDLEGVKKTLTEGKKDWIAYAQAVFDTADAEQTAAAQGKSFTQVSEELTEKILSLIDPTRQLRLENEALDKAFADGSLRITETQLKLAKLDPAVRALIQPLDNIHEKIQKAFEAGDLDVEDMQKAVREAMEGHKAATDEITEFWRKAAEEMQSSMSGLFFDIMQGNLKDLGSSFKRTIDKMVADVLAAKAATALFGSDFGKGGSIGGLVGAGLSALGLGGGSGGTASMAAAAVNDGNLEGALLGSYDTGTDFVPRTGPYKLHQGERVLTREENKAFGRAVNVTNHFTINGPTDRRSQAQIGAAVGDSVARARFRNR